MSKKQKFNVDEWRQWKGMKEGPAKSLLLGKILKDNEGLAVTFAFRFSYVSIVEIEQEDLFQAAIIGLIIAMERYDPEKGAFSTYSAWWVRNEIQKLQSKGPLIVRPTGSGFPYKVQHKIASYYALHGEDPEAEDIEGEDPKQWEFWRAQIFKYTSIDDVRLGENTSPSPGAFREYVADPAPSAEERMIEAGKALKIQRLWLSLSEREREKLLNGECTAERYEKICRRFRKAMTWDE